MRDLVIVESSRKASTLADSAKVGEIKDVIFMSTEGPLLDMPRSTAFSGIDKNFSEVGLFYKNAALAESIKYHASRSRRVFVATDVNFTGDLIAWDVKELIGSGVDVMRLRMKSLGSEAFVDALSHAEPILEVDAREGRVRRVFDRLVRCVIAVSTSETGLHSGFSRYAASAVSVLKHARVPLCEARIVLPAKAGRDPFTCVLAVSEENRSTVDEIMEQAIDFAECGGAIGDGHSAPAPATKPWSYGEAVAHVARQAKLPIAEVMRHLASLYEAGRLSYPYSSANAVSGDAIAMLVSLAAKQGIRFDARRIVAYSRSDSGVHESPRPADIDIDIGKPLALLPGEEAVLVLLTRNLLSCGLPFLQIKPDESSLPGWARSLPFTRTVCQRVRPWAMPILSSEYRNFETDEVALRILTKISIAPLHFWPALIRELEKLMDERDEMQELRDAWSQGMPAELFDLGLIQAAEVVLGNIRTSSYMGVGPAARNLIEQFGLVDLVNSVLE